MRLHHRTATLGEHWEDCKGTNTYSKQQHLHLTYRAQWAEEERLRDQALITELGKTNAAAASIVKCKDIFLGQTLRKASTQKAVKSLSFGPSTLLCSFFLWDTFWFLEILSAGMFLGSFENLQDAEPCNQKGSGAQKGGWCEMLEGEQKDYETRSSKKTTFKAPLPYNVEIIPGDTSIGIT